MIVDQLFENDKKKKLNEVDPRNYDSDEDYYDAVEADDLDLDKFGNGWDIPDEIAVLRNQLRNTQSPSLRQQIENKIKRYEDIYYGEDEVEEGNKFFQQHGIGAQNGKFPEPRKPGPGQIPSKSEKLGKDGLIYHWQDPRGRQSVAESTSRELRLAVYQVLLDIHFGAKYGDEMIDTVTDELGDYFDDVEASDDAVLKKVYAYVRQEGAEAEGDPARMDRVALNAIEFLNYEGARGNLNEFAPGMAEDLNRRGFLQGLGMAAAGAAGLGAAGAAQAGGAPAEWIAKVERAKTLMAKGQSREQTARIMGIKGPNPGGAGPMSGDWGAVNYAAQEMRVKESTTSKQRKLNEAMLMEDPIYRNFKRLGRYIAERKMTEKEILQVFADAEADMTNKDTGANRTMLGRGKDTATKFAGNVSGAVKGVLDSMRTSVPVQAVEVAYDQATDALADVAGGQDGPVMNVIKQYRMLAKEYPKTTGLVRSALIMAAGMATGGAAPIAIIGALGALDRALKGNTLFNSLVGGATDTALAGVSRAVAGAMAPDATLTQPGNAGAHDMDMMSNMGDVDTSGQVPDADSLAPGEEVVPTDAVPSRFDDIVDNAIDYKVKPDDTLSKILADRKINPEAFKRLPGNDVFFGPDGNPNILKAGQTIKLPDPADVADLNKMSWTTPSDPSLAKDFGNPDFYTGQYNQNSTSGLDAANNLKQQELGRWGSDNGMSAARVAKDAGGGMDIGGGSGLPSHASAAGDYGMGGNAPIDYSQPGPTGTDSLGNKLEYGMPVSDNGSFIPPDPKLPAEELATQQAAYDAWKADFMRRFPNATQLPDGSMQGIKPGLNTMQIFNKPTLPAEVQESVKIKKLSFDKLVDQKTTVMAWALNESVGRKSKSVNLTTVGTYTVFENVDRYRKALLEYVETGPGRPQLPDLYRPDMPDAPMQPADPAKKSWLGKGIDYLDKGIKKVGGALSNFGHQFTTNVTKEKLKMNWHQAGKPSDSDALAAFLVKQGVPQDVVSSVFGKMGIPYTGPEAEPVAEPAAVTPGSQKQVAFYGTNPKTGKPWTVDELQAKAAAKAPTPEPADKPADEPNPLVKYGTVSAKPAATGFPGEDPQGPNYVGRREVARRQAARDAEAAKKPAAPNFAQNAGYKSVNYAPNIKTGVSLPNPFAPTPAAKPTGTRVVAGGPTPDEQAKLAQRIAQATAKPVAEMLSMVETKEDVAKIKQFVDQTFVKYGAVSESAFVVRNKLIEHITQVGAQRRREYARKS